MPVNFTIDSLHKLLKGPAGGKITDRCPGLAARLRGGQIVFEWRGRVRGQPAPLTITLADWADRMDRQCRSADGSSVSREDFDPRDLANLPPIMTIAEARQVASWITACARHGRDARKMIGAPELTLARAIDRYMAEHQKHLRRGKQVIANLRRHLAELLDTPVADITKRDLLDAIRVLTDRGQWSQATRPALTLPDCSTGSRIRRSSPAIAASRGA